MTLPVNVQRSESETWVLECTFTDEDGAAIDLTGAAAIRWALADQLDGFAMLEATLGDGITVTDADAGQATINIAVADHADIPPGSYIHDCQITLSNGEVIGQFRGTFTVAASIA